MIQALTVSVRGADVPAPVVRLVDRRSSRPRAKDWLLTKSVERVLFGETEVCPRPLLPLHPHPLAHAHPGARPRPSLRARSAPRAPSTSS